MSAAKPVLLYDGDCGFCRRWAARWKVQTGGRLELRPRAGLDAVRLVEGGRESSGAQAVFRALAYAPRRGWLIRLYERAPAFAAVSEACYRFVAARRLFFSRVTALLWGADLEPPTYYRARWLFVKALALAYLFAFVSLGTQIEGLVGSRGVLPAVRFLAAARAQLGGSAFTALPSVFWLGAGDAALKAACWLGAGFSVVALLGFFPGPALLLCWALYLSLLGVGQDFLGFQWDILLVEAGFLAVFLAPWSARPRLGRDAPHGAFPLFVRWLLFRLMLESGCVKLLSRDPSWRSLTALYYHYETQPLPTPLAWYAHHLPRAASRASCAAVFFIELVVPWLIFLPRRPKAFAFACFVLLQALIAATGNYCFFNWLTVALALLLLDDSLLGLPPAERGSAFGSGWRARAALPVGALVFGLGGLQLASMLGARLPRPAESALAAAEPFHLVDTYGLFAVMTTRRDEIAVEGSDDGRDWREYSFRWKPGDVRRRPGVIEPFQPRLDWQMWFAALGPVQQSPWLVNLLVRLLQGEPKVLALLGPDPFPDHPPRFVRALLYRYRFATSEERRRTGAWWTRELEGPYCPPITLNPPRAPRGAQKP